MIRLNQAVREGRRWFGGTPPGSSSRFLHNQASVLSHTPKRQNRRQVFCRIPPKRADMLPTQIGLVEPTGPFQGCVRGTCLMPPCPQIGMVGRTTHPGKGASWRVQKAVGRPLHPRREIEGSCGAPSPKKQKHSPCRRGRRHGKPPSARRRCAPVSRSSPVPAAVRFPGRPRPAPWDSGGCGGNTHRSPPPR
jgi:hypothetical protein